MKNKGKLSFIILLIFILLGGGFLYFQSQPQTKDNKEENVQENTAVEETIEGIVVQINEQSITIQAESQEKTFAYGTTMKEEYDRIAKGDTIAITYLREDAKEIQTIHSITLLLTHSDELRDYIEEMSLEEKIGQMILARCPKQDAVEDLATYHLGGFMLFDRDVKDETKASLTETIASYQANASIPLFIAVDEEGGTVNRLSNYVAFRGVPFHSPQSLYEEGGMDLILSDNEEKATLLLSMGINVNLAPVADVSTDPDDFIYDRSFGKDVQATADYIEKVVAQSKTLEIGSTLKHFPGYGNNVDTHTGIAYDERTMESFQQSDFLPFIAGIKAGADAVLVSHNVVNAMDPDMPASLSHKVHDILRNDLHFNGVIMSDDMDMKAIADFTDYDTSAIAAIKAGNDLILCSNYDTQIPAIVQAVQDQEIAMTQIDESVYRILTWKKQLHIFD